MPNLIKVNIFKLRCRDKESPYPFEVGNCPGLHCYQFRLGEREIIDGKHFQNIILSGDGFRKHIEYTEEGVSMFMNSQQDLAGGAIILPLDYKDQILSNLKLEKGSSVRLRAIDEDVLIVVEDDRLNSLTIGIALYDGTYCELNPDNEECIRMAGMTSKDIAQEKKVADEKLIGINKVVVDSIRLFFINYDNDIYRLGIITKIVNNNTDFEYFVKRISIRGEYKILGDGKLPFTIQSIDIDKNTHEIKGIKTVATSAKVEGNKILSRGSESYIKFIMPDELILDFNGIDPNTVEGGYPTFEFNGTWYVLIENTFFEVGPSLTNVEKFIGLDEWNFIENYDNI